jgi:predicted DsbA family dithiol-disulfide isomerase
MNTLRHDFDFDISYLPFELNPQTPKEGFNLKVHLSKKFGGDEKYTEITQHVTHIAALEGLKFDFEKQAVSPNTKDAHRVIWFTKKEGKQLQVKEALMSAYFEQGVDLTKEENLISVASSIGLDPLRIAALLDSDEGLLEVNQLEQQNYQRGITGVPFYIINNQYGISGAQPSDVFIQALNKIGKEVTLTEREACDADGKNC